MRRRPATSSELITKVNVTPIIDVALVLVIILLVTAPMMSVSDLPVRLPEARTREAEDERNVSVTIGTHGELAVDDRVVAAPTLAAAVAERLAQPGNEGVLVVVRADTATPYSDVRRTLDVIRQSGARRIAIATRQKGAVTP
ncbi:MAG: biopolymer transporter ExbD [Candidatus Eisenbacteria bacterium]